MSIADEDQNPKRGKKLDKSFDAIAALRAAMEKRLADAQTEDAEKEKLADAPATEQAERKDDASTSAKTPDPSEWSKILFRIADRSQKLTQDFLERNREQISGFAPPDPAHLGEAFLELTNRILNDPERFVEAQINLWQGYIQIWQSTLAKLQGKPSEPIVTPSFGDKRFQDEAWQDVWIFDFLKQSYLLTSRWVQGLVQGEIAKLDPKLARKLDFYTRQMVDAISPSNFWLTNPEVLRATIESGGENLVRGLEHLLDDLERGRGQLQISMSDPQAFKVGLNLATSPGKVVYQNELMQLIQYEPSTPNIHRTPLLIMPPWINKYYILDLQEKNSLIRYVVSQGYTVFCISWVNPDARYAQTNFDDYMMDGALAAMREVKRATEEDHINIVGYCIGGTLLASALAYLNAVPQKLEGLPTVASATYFVAMVDFAEPGDIGVFIDEDQVRALEAHMTKLGYLDALTMSATFNLLRANDLIWSFVVNNYLLGKEPFPFDILYWNSDSTNLAAAMHSFYLRKMYIENKLAQPDGLQMKGVPIDVRTIATPSFLISTRDDHIAPWRSTYVATHLYRGPVKFVLAGSGHIAGVINPPSANKYGYWTNDKCPVLADDWLKDAEQHHGSWWPEWLNWLKDYSGEQIPARQIDAGRIIEDAPGSYVRIKAI